MDRVIALHKKKATSKYSPFKKDIKTIKPVIIVLSPQGPSPFDPTPTYAHSFHLSNVLP